MSTLAEKPAADPVERERPDVDRAAARRAALLAGETP